MILTILVNHLIYQILKEEKNKKNTKYGELFNKISKLINTEKSQFFYLNFSVFFFFYYQ